MEITNWEKFKIKDILQSFERGKVHSQNDLPEGNEYFYVGAKKEQNGVMCSCGYDEDLISKGNCIIFICNGEGSVGYANYMDRDFYASGDLILGYGDFLNKYNALFITTLLDRERPKYSFGRKYGKYVKETTIPLPVNKEKKPDWECVEEYVKENIIPQLPSKSKSVWLGKYKKKPLLKKTTNINSVQHKYFRLDKLFSSIKKGKAYNAISLTPSKESNSIAYITRTNTNNGRKMRVVNEEFENIEQGNAITIGDTTATIFYQQEKFICGDHMVILRASWLNKYTAMYVTTVLNKERFRYNYGRSFKKETIEKTRIKLPINDKKGPDWKLIEDYIKSLPYSSSI